MATNEFKIKDKQIVNKVANTLIINANHQVFEHTVNGSIYLKNTSGADAPSPGPMFGEQIYSEQFTLTFTPGDNIEDLVLKAAVKQLGVTLI